MIMAPLKGASLNGRNISTKSASLSAAGTSCQNSDPLSQLMQDGKSGGRNTRECTGRKQLPWRENYQIEKDSINFDEAYVENFRMKPLEGATYDLVE